MNCSVVGCRRKKSAKGMCNIHYQRMLKRGSTLRPLRIKLPFPCCSVTGCCNQARSKSSVYCEKHYYRKRRGNDPTQDPVYGYRSVNAAGYMVLRRCSHPLATKDMVLCEHRRVAYDACGGVCPDCFWCSKPLSWATAVVDHFNENKIDNRKENLLVACNDCNRARGAMKPFIASLSDSGLRHLIESFEHMRG